MDLKQLECFVRVAELGSYTKASILMSVSQPTLSRQIRHLEVELSQNLFNRNGRGITLTEEGAFFLMHAKTILSQHERALQGLKQLKNTLVGNVVVGVPPVVGRILTSNLITAFRRRFPDASVEIIEGKSWSIHEWLLMGRIDIGIWYNPIRSAHIDITPLVTKELFLVSPLDGIARRNAAVEFRDLRRIPLILPSYPNTQRMLIEATAEKAGVKLDIPLQINGTPLIFDLVHQGHGYTIQPKYMVEESPLAGKLRMNRIVNPSMTMVLSLAVSSQRRLTNLVRETSKLIQTFLGKGSEFAAR